MARTIPDPPDLSGKPWSLMQLSGQVSIWLPAGTEWQLRDDRRALVVAVASSPASELMIARWAFEPDEAPGMAALRSNLDLFFDQCVPPAVGQVLPWRAEAFRLPDVMGYDGTADQEGDIAWLGRTCMEPGGSAFTLLHWNGPTSHLAMVRAMIQTFRPYT